MRALRDLAGPAVLFPANKPIRYEGDPVEKLYLLQEGWVVSSASLADGARQIFKVHFPGDILGAPSLAITNAAETLRALTDTLVCSVSIAGLSGIFAQFPRLAMLFFMSAQEERLILMERLLSVGRQRGVKRLAAFLIHVFDRLAMIGLRRDNAVDLPMSQELIGDVIGLTTVHTNRVFSELERRSLIERDGRRIVFCDVDGLRELAGLPPRQFVRNPAWLPEGPQ